MVLYPLGRKRGINLKLFYDYNPIALTVYFLSAVLGVITSNPVITLISLSGSIITLAVLRGLNLKFFLFAMLGLILMSLVNPIFSHRGDTVLVVVNHLPITLESVLFGINASASVISAVIWFRAYTLIMTSDRYQYIFGKLSPKTALLLSMMLRFVPLFSEETKKVRSARLAVDSGSKSSFSNELGVISAMTGRALENGIISADSMTARGYGLGKRSSFSLYSFKKSDLALLIPTLVFLGVMIFSWASGELSFGFYPTLSDINKSPIALICYASYGITALIPTVIQTKGEIKWKYYLSKM